MNEAVLLQFPEIQQRNGQEGRREERGQEGRREERGQEGQEEGSEGQEERGQEEGKTSFLVYSLWYYYY